MFSQGRKTFTDFQTLERVRLTRTHDSESRLIGILSIDGQVFPLLHIVSLHSETTRECRYVLSVSAATPGSSSPARNSRVAPPPVEMCVMRLATPARVTAETESPPPTITVAPRSAASATACATPIVPWSNGGSSNT